MTPVSALVEIDPQGLAWITGANVKVVEVVLDKLAFGWTAEEIHFQHPGLSLAQIHAALSYCYENQAVIDQEIDRQRRDAEQSAAPLRNSPIYKRLLALKKA